MKQDKWILNEIHIYTLDCFAEDVTVESIAHRRIKRQKGRRWSSLIFGLFVAARVGGRDYCDTKF